MTGFLQLLFQGVSLGMTYALVALGFAVVYRSSGVINFAQGAMLLLGAYLISYLAVDAGLPFFVAVAAVAIAMAALGAGFDYVVLRHVVAGPTFVGVMITIGAGIALTSALDAAFGANPRLLGDPWGSSTFHVGGVVITWVKLWAIVITAVVIGAYFALDRFTRWGLAMRATADDDEAALSVGVPITLVHAASWALAGALAAIGGLFLAGFPNSPGPGLGDAALRAFPAVVLGGLASPVGAITGGLVIGVVEVLTSGYAPSWLGANFYSVAPYVVMILVLLVRPYGLFGSRPAERV